MEIVDNSGGPLRDLSVTTTGTIQRIESINGQTLMMILASDGEVDFVEYPKSLSPVERALLRGSQVTHKYSCWSYYTPSDQILDVHYNVDLHLGSIRVPFLHSELKI